MSYERPGLRYPSYNRWWEVDIHLGYIRSQDLRTTCLSSGYEIHSKTYSTTERRPSAYMRQRPQNFRHTATPELSNKDRRVSVDAPRVPLLLQISGPAIDCTTPTDVLGTGEVIGVYAMFFMEALANKDVPLVVSTLVHSFCTVYVSPNGWPQLCFRSVLH